jgi:hypothetical protein
LTGGEAPTGLEAQLLDLLRRTPRHAELVSRLSGLLRRRNVDPEQVEEALAGLESRPAILVREHYCADPHLASADLRVAAVIEPCGDPQRDPIADAAERIDSVWQRWLNEYLSNHTCV